jgi:hypothetical protein
MHTLDTHADNSIGQLNDQLIRPFELHSELRQAQARGSAPLLA